MSTPKKRIYTRVPVELYDELRTMATTGGYRSIHALVTEVLKNLSARRAAIRREICSPDVVEEIETMFASFTEHQQPQYGMGKRQKGHREP